MKRCQLPFYLDHIAKTKRLQNTYDLSTIAFGIRVRSINKITIYFWQTKIYACLHEVFKFNLVYTVFSSFFFYFGIYVHIFFFSYTCLNKKVANKNPNSLSSFYLNSVSLTQLNKENLSFLRSKHTMHPTHTQVILCLSIIFSNKLDPEQ